MGVTGEGGETPIELERVGLRYLHGPEILRDVSLRVPPRSFQFLTGPSGAGKSSLLRLLMMTVRPTSGLVRVFGRDVTALRPADLTILRRRMGLVFQDFRLLDHLSAYENVALPLRVQGYEEATYRGEVTELLQWVGLGDRVASMPLSMSGGEKQRVAIARALIARPDIILADEPTGNVDPPLARRLLRLFVELNRLGTSVLIATHDLSLMDQTEARRLVLAEGRLHVDE